LHHILLAVILLIAVLLSACDQSPDIVGDFFRAPSAAEMNARVMDLARRGQVAEALHKGEAFLAKHPDSQGDLHRTLARIYVESGDAQSAVRHLEVAGLTQGARQSESSRTLPQNTAGTLVNEQRTAPTPPESPAAPTAPKPVVDVGVEVDGAVARAAPDGVNARAGNANAAALK
jgi:hypothetical protein